MSGNMATNIKYIMRHGYSSVMDLFSVKYGVPLARPTTVYLGITRKCCARCIMCSCWREDDRDTDLDLDTAKKLFRELKGWLGTCLVQCGGGEPFMNKRFFDMVESAKSNGLLVGVVTNAMLVDKKMAEKVMRAGFFNINISIDGLKPETHDYLRGTRGSLKLTTDAIEHLLEYKKVLKADTRIILKPIIMGFNIGELTGIVERYGKRKGINGINFQPLSETTKETKDLWIKDIKDIDRLADTLVRMKKDNYPILNSYSNIEELKRYFRKEHDPEKNPCSLGYRSVFVEQHGDVSLCGNGFPSVGNIREKSIREIFFSEEAISQRKSIRKCRRYCMGTCHVKRGLVDKYDMFKNLFLRD